MFEDLFRRRIEDGGIKIARALDTNFTSPQNQDALRAEAYIEQYRTQQASAWEQELFKQRKRLADAERSLKEKETKRALEDQRIATNKVQALLERLGDLRRPESRPNDSRIFPMYFAPVIVRVDDRQLIRPMRYACRLAGKPANYDHRYPGTYNARRDNLSGFWSDAYAKHHAIMVVDSFFENVPNHLYEKRALAEGEKETNMVLHFQPQPAAPMLVACLWSHWTGKEEADLYSFAAVTDEPPVEIAATGHQRCIIALKEEHVNAWLTPASVSKDRLDEILNDRAAPYYEHRIAA